MYEFMIFKTGNYPQGNWPKERTQRMVDAYDPVRSFEAPVVIGHRYFTETDEDEAAHGWVQSLRMDGNGKVFAAVDELSPDIKRAVMEKKYKYISCEIWENDLKDPSAAPYLRAIVLLGRTSPAVPTAKLPSLFSFSNEGIVCSQDKERKLTYFSRKIKPEEFELEPGRKHKKEETIDMDELEKLKQENEKLKDEIKEKDSQISSFAKKEKDHKEQEARKDAESFYTTMKNKGKLPPALFERAVELDQSLSEDQRKSFRDFLSSFEKVFDLSGKHFADKKDAPENFSASLVKQIKVYQEENKIASFEEAAKALQVKRPELFA